MRLEQLPERYRVQAMHQLARTSRIGRIQEQGKPVEEPEKPKRTKKDDIITPDPLKVVRKFKVSGSSRLRNGGNWTMNAIRRAITAVR